MSHGSHKTIDLQSALVNPGSIFADPQEVLGHPSLSRENKIEILRRWEYDASGVAVAEEEGMTGGETTKLFEVLSALHELIGEVDVENSPPTKQGGV